MIQLAFNLITFSLSCALIFFLSHSYCKRSGFREGQQSRKLFFAGLLVKCLASVAFCYYHLNVYKAGDTIHYFHDAFIISNQFWNDPNEFFHLWFEGQRSWDKAANFPIARNVIYYNFYNVNTVRLTVPFALFSYGNIYACSIFLAFIAYSGVWKLYELLSYSFAAEKRILAVLLFVPSVVFWTSGILKDTYILAAVCWMVYAVFQLMRLARIRLKYLLIILLSFFLIILVKPYVLIALLPSILIWVFVEQLYKAKNRLTKVLLAPLFAFFTLGLILLLFSLLQNNIGVYGDFNHLVEYGNSVRKAYSTTDNSGILKEGVLGASNSFSIANGITSGFTVMFRPQIWESWNFSSLFGGMENSLILLLNGILVLSILFHLKVLHLLIKKPFLLFCLFYSLVLAIGIGLSISNFGAIIRFRTAFILFYLVPFIVLIARVWKRFVISNESIEKDEFIHGEQLNK